MAAADGAAKDSRTVFVRGVSFATDEQALESVFSDVGPVKSCFLVRQKGDAKHKGFGFVVFSLPEDAERAVEALHG
jgi:nucleolar protein 4